MVPYKFKARKAITMRKKKLFDCFIRFINFTQTILHFILNSFVLKVNFNNKDFFQ